VKLSHREVTCSLTTHFPFRPIRILFEAENHYWALVPRTRHTDPLVQLLEKGKKYGKRKAKTAVNNKRGRTQEAGVATVPAPKAQSKKRSRFLQDSSDAPPKDVRCEPAAATQQDCTNVKCTSCGKGKRAQQSSWCTCAVCGGIWHLSCAEPQMSGPQKSGQRPYHCCTCRDNISKKENDKQDGNKKNQTNVP
jgi:hypothetical protein